MKISQGTNLPRSIQSSMDFSPPGTGIIQEVHEKISKGQKLIPE
jgi:hypothetical protein